MAMLRVCGYCYSCVVLEKVTFPFIFETNERKVKCACILFERLLIHADAFV